jgi:glycerate 2-kinase
MKICICPDSFKGTLTSVQVSQTVRDGLQSSSSPSSFFSFDLCPMSDGGKGFLASAIVAAQATTPNLVKLNLFSVEVVDPYFNESINWTKRNKAQFAIISSLTENSFVVVIETAEACGIHYPPPPSSKERGEVEQDNRSPLEATSFGVGEILKEAFRVLETLENTKSAKIKVMIGLGGSATNDCGVGCLQALGAKFSFIYDTNRKGDFEQPILAKSLNTISSVDLTPMNKYLASVASKFRNMEIVLVSDVTNPLLGETGATKIYGPQKGAKTQQHQDLLERGLKNAHKILVSQGGSHGPFENIPGAGAAGGLGGALIFAFRLNFPNSKQTVQVLPGAETFAQMTRLEERIKNSDLVISGEGSFDSQTIQYGKTVAYIANIAKKYNKPMIVVCGLCDEEAARDAASRNPPVLVASTVRKFGKKASLNEPGKCLKSVVSDEVLKMIQQRLGSKL